MLWAGGTWAVVWGLAAVVGLALPIMIWVGGNRANALAWLGYDAAWLVPLGFLPLWAIVPGTLVTVSAFTIGVWRQAVLRRASAPLRVVVDATPPGPEVLARVDELVAGGFEPTVELASDGDPTHHLVFFRDGAIGSVVLSWASPPHRSPASTLIAHQVTSRLVGGGAIVTTEHCFEPQAPGRFVQTFPRETDVERQLAHHARAVAFVRGHGLDVEPPDPDGIAARLAATDVELRAFVEAHSWQIATEAWLRTKFRRSIGPGGLWERPEVPAELDAWAAGLEERLDAAEVAREAAGEPEVR